jgi:hypothetical protein
MEWLKATTPSTQFRQTPGVNHSAILLTTVAEQLTVDKYRLVARADPPLART